MKILGELKGVGTFKIYDGILGHEKSAVKKIFTALYLN
jgi:hypothetical protein